jgi:hypothetical protein
MVCVVKLEAKFEYVVAQPLALADVIVVLFFN